MNRRRWRGAAAIALVAMTVACTTTVPPSPTPSTSGEAAPSAASPAAASVAPAATATPRPTAEPGLASRVEIGTIDPALTNPIGEFRSDARSIVFASARAEDAGPNGTPDLWRITPPDGEPELLWRNPERDHALVVIAGDIGTYAFVDMPLTGERAWTLWLLPRDATKPIRLDEHPGDEDVSSLVPSVAVNEDTVVWTAFDRGSAGPVSQLRIARAPDWEPRTIRELPAAEGELWFPSVAGTALAYVEVHYLDGGADDERQVYLTSTAPGSEPQRLDRSGLATMPLIVDGGVLWKEAEEGFAMMNWGKMFRYDLADGSVRRLSTLPQQWVNYPSAGYRYAAWWGADSFQIGVYDLLADEAEVLERHSLASDTSALRPHVAGDLLVWLEVVLSPIGERSTLKYAFLPGPRDP